jgi:MurNAc alpha-1-phosphate uridylyltransferase
MNNSFLPTPFGGANIAGDISRKAVIYKGQPIDTIMLFAAGRGTRMYPLTKDTPKPLVKILGKPILYWVLDLVLTYPFKRIIINTHYLSEQIEEAIEHYILNTKNIPEIILSFEEDLLETGGGLKNNLKYCLSELIFTINSDSIILPQVNPFYQMLDSWDENIMDIMMLVYSTKESIGYSGIGDFFRKKDGSLYRLNDEQLRPYMNAGIQLINKNIVEQHPEKIFSLKQFYFDPLYGSRLFSVINKGSWLHATSPQDVQEIENFLKSHPF